MPMQQMLLLGGGPPGPDIDDVFHVNTYSGNQTNRSFNTGLDFATHGGAVWNSVRNQELQDKAASKSRGTISIGMQGDNDDTNTSWFKSWNSDGYSIGTNTTGNTDGFWNKNSHTYVNWGWRNCDNFFKEFTWTGDGNSSGKTITHGLGSTPGFIIVNGDYGRPTAYHKAFGNSKYIKIDSNENAQSFSGGKSWSVGATTFTSPDDQDLNMNNNDYVGWAFADHSSGGTFGAAGNKKAIVCDSYTGNGSNTGPSVTVGFQPQWLFITSYGGPDPTSGRMWFFDSARGFGNTMHEGTAVENDAGTNFVSVNSTGFSLTTNYGHINENGTYYLYVAIAAST
tara:strand:- start:378 stop:1394 length:1017 start_codon:yes stop_codon:yes gene_type:complete